MPRNYTIEEDLEFGLTAETDLLNTLRSFFKNNFYKIDNPRSPWDYQNDTHFFEMKSRRNNKDTYPTTMIPKNKVRHPNTIFLFNFYDGVYYIHYDKDLFDTFECRLNQRQSNSNHTNRIQETYFIPVKLLSPICLVE